MTDAPVPAEGLEEDLWAWLHAQPAEDGPDLAGFEVTAVVEPLPGVDAERCLAAVREAEFPPDQVLVDDFRADLPGEWLWLLPADCEPAPTALQELLTAIARRPELDIVGPVLVEPRRRGPGTLVRQFGQTITANGRIRGLVPPGELYQGQLEDTDSFGVAAVGMLVRGQVWRDLGGFTTGVPADLRGAEFCWRARLAGHEVAAIAQAQVVSRSEPGDPGDDRAAGLAMVAAHAPAGRRWLTTLRLVVMSLLAALGFALGKDGERAAGELLGLGRWLGRRQPRTAITGAARAVSGTAQTRARIRQLRPGPGAGLRRFAEGVAGQVSDWLGTFAGPAPATSLDELTGDDFAAQSRFEPRIPALVAGATVTVGMAVAAGRSLFGAGFLQGERLLPAPAGWRELLDSYLLAVPGQAELSGPAWTGLAGLASLITAGRPEFLVSVLVMGCVPLAWLAAFRFLRQSLGSATLAGVGAFCYAVAPAVIGILNLGAIGAALWTVLLPVFAYSLRAWLTEETLLWRRAAAAALWALMLVALVPLAWAVLLPLAVGLVLRRRSATMAGQAALLVVAPLLLVVGPWRETLLSYPGRLLTGIDPSLGGTDPVEPWQVLLGRVAGQLPPLWLSVIVIAGLWAVALAGALRRGAAAASALVAAALAAGAALGLTRLLVWVPPGEWARPEALEWLVLMIGGLVLAAAWGLDGVAEELRGANLGLRHLGTLALAAVTAAVVVLAGGWWVVAGQSGLSRGPASTLPPFVRNAQVSDTPGRTFVLEVGADAVDWSVTEGDMPRLGDVERGLFFSGDEQAVALAASVAGRLATGSADDELLGDLRSLGVSYIWLRGGDAAERLGISNTPGLGVGTSDGDTTVWPVPESGLAVLVTQEGPQLVGPGTELSGGTELRLAEPVDPRRRVLVDDHELTPLEVAGPGSAYDVAGLSGTLELPAEDGTPWWAWLQLAGLLLLGLVAAPGIRRQTALAPRRVQERAPARPAASAPRRAAGGGS